MSSTKLLEESLIWFDYRLSKCPGRGKALFATSFSTPFQVIFKSFSSKTKNHFGSFWKIGMSSTINVDHLDSSTLQLHMHFHFHPQTSWQIFSHAGFRQKCKMASKKSSQKQFLQFTAPKAKNRQNFGGGWPPGMFIED